MTASAVAPLEGALLADGADRDRGEALRELAEHLQPLRRLKPLQLNLESTNAVTQTLVPIDITAELRHGVRGFTVVGMKVDGDTLELSTDEGCPPGCSSVIRWARQA